MRSAEILFAWTVYFAVHSLLAATGFKAWVGCRWPQFMPAYRLLFNAIGALTLLPVLWLVRASPGAWLWQWRGAWAWAADGLTLAAILCFFASARAYDMGEFFGLRQLRENNGDVPQTFAVSSFHRFVRHPWYSIALVLIWTRDMNEALLISALAVTVYIVVGSRLEERKLVDSFGETYRRYMTAVPGLIPLPWKFLSAKEAATWSGRIESQPPPRLV